MRQWTEEERRKQAEIIKRHKPWEKSTGPKTEQGKKRCRLNALKHGHYAAHFRHLEVALRLNRAFLREMNFYAQTDLQILRKMNEIVEKRDTSLPECYYENNTD